MKQTLDVTKLALITLSGFDFALPMEDAVSVIKGLANAQQIDKEYVSGAGYTYYKSDKKPDVSLQLLSEETYLEAQINGYKHKP